MIPWRAQNLPAGAPGSRVGCQDSSARQLRIKANAIEVVTENIAGSRNTTSRGTQQWLVSKAP